MLVSKNSKGNITITLQDAGEKHAMWHALNLCARTLVEYSNDNADFHVIDKVNVNMWKDYNKHAAEYEKSPIKPTPIVLKNTAFHAIDYTDKSYDCPLCRNKRPEFCVLCKGTGRVKLTFPNIEGERS